MVKGTIEVTSPLWILHATLKSFHAISASKTRFFGFSCPVTVGNKARRSQVISVIAGSSGIAAARCSVAGSAGLAVGVSSDFRHGHGLGVGVQTGLL